MLCVSIFSSDAWCAVSDIFRGSFVSSVLVWNDTELLPDLIEVAEPGLGWERANTPSLPAFENPERLKIVTGIYLYIISFQDSKETMLEKSWHHFWYKIKTLNM